MRFFFDNCMSPLLAKALAVMDHEVEIVPLRDKFPEATSDVVWLEKLGREKEWIIVSGDPKITRKPHERQALENSNLPAFFMVNHWARVEKWEQAALLFRWWPNMKWMASRLKPGEIVQVLRAANFKTKPLT